MRCPLQLHCPMQSPVSLKYLAAGDEPIFCPKTAWKKANLTGRDNCPEGSFLFILWSSWGLTLAMWLRRKAMWENASPVPGEFQFVSDPSLLSLVPSLSDVKCLRPSTVSLQAKVAFFPRNLKKSPHIWFMASNLLLPVLKLPMPALSSVGLSRQGAHLSKCQSRSFWFLTEGS